MDSNICNVCGSMQTELYQIGGYQQLPPMCLKCTETYNMKSTNQYPSHHIGTTGIQSLQQTQSSDRTSGALQNMPMTNESATQQQIKEEREQNELQNKAELPTLPNGDPESVYGDGGTCGLCSKVFARKSSLLAHMKNHSVDRKFICSYCQKGFTQAANLRNHERIHRNERPFICNDCGKAFTQVTNLNNHRRLHTGERPFVCIELNCGRSFAQVTNLNNHMKTHHKIQQYVCNQCPKKFTQVTSLNQHLLVHSGVRSFVCPQSPDKTFKQQSQLSQHMMKKHGIYGAGKTAPSNVLKAISTKAIDGLKFKCNVCFSAYAHESLLNKHMQRHIKDSIKYRRNMCPIPNCTETFAQRELLTRHVELDHQQVMVDTNNRTTTTATTTTTTTTPTMPSSSSLSVGKFNCYFDGCDMSFSDTNQLNEHLMADHNMLFKDVDARSKMNLMFLEQIKHQMSGQYALTNAIYGGDDGSGELRTHHNQQQQHQHQMRSESLAHSVQNVYKDVVADGSHMLGGGGGGDAHDISTRHHNYYKPEKKTKADSQVRVCQ